MRCSITHPTSYGQSDWRRLTLCNVTSSPTITQGSRMGEWVKHPCYNHIWVSSQGSDGRTLVQDHFGNDQTRCAYPTKPSIVCVPRYLPMSSWQGVPFALNWAPRTLRRLV